MKLSYIRKRFHRLAVESVNDITDRISNVTTQPISNLTQNAFSEFRMERITDITFLLKTDENAHFINFTIFVQLADNLEHT